LDPIAQLQDIHLPEQINQFPIALGWWILSILLLTLLSLLIVATIRYRRNRKNKNLALKQLKQNPQMPIKQIVALLKWTAMQYFPRGDSAKLYGDSFQQFLMHQLPEKSQQTFYQLSTPAFEQLYQQELEDQVDNSLTQAAKLWLSMALPPKTVRENMASIAQVIGDKS
jgi:hypothetical protein